MPTYLVTFTGYRIPSVLRFTTLPSHFLPHPAFFAALPLPADGAHHTAAYTTPSHHLLPCTPPSPSLPHAYHYTHLGFYLPVLDHTGAVHLHRRARARVHLPAGPTHTHLPHYTHLPAHHRRCHHAAYTLPLLPASLPSLPTYPLGFSTFGRDVCHTRVPLPCCSTWFAAVLPSTCGYRAFTGTPRVRTLLPAACTWVTYTRTTTPPHPTPPGLVTFPPAYLPTPTPCPSPGHAMLHEQPGSVTACAPSTACAFADLPPRVSTTHRFTLPPLPTPLFFLLQDTSHHHLHTHTQLPHTHPSPHPWVPSHTTCRMFVIWLIGWAGRILTWTQGLWNLPIASFSLPLRRAHRPPTPVFLTLYRCITTHRSTYLLLLGQTRTAAYAQHWDLDALHARTAFSFQRVDACSPGPEPEVLAWILLTQAAVTSSQWARDATVLFGAYSPRTLHGLARLHATLCAISVRTGMDVKPT